MAHFRARLLTSFAAGAVAALVALPITGVRPGAATRYEELSLFTSVLGLIRKNYVEPVEDRKLIEGAIRGMLAELDPHSSFLTPEVYREMQIDARGEFAGLGIEISKSSQGFIDVIAPIEGTPAHAAGIRARDQIVAICPEEPPEDWNEPCRSTKDMTLVEAVQLMRGPRGTPITIQIFREGFEEPRAFTIVRDIVKVRSVIGRLLEPGYGYARVRSFQERTADDLRALLDRLRSESGGRLEGLVLDLRDNPGGLLDQAVAVADVWLEEGLIVSTRGRLESQRQEFHAGAEGTEPPYPLVVLVNAGSASASEIVAGALQDHHRALVLGTDTFGKGSVQTIIPLEDGSGLRLTTALYYTPADRSIQEVGIHPDIVVDAAEPVAETGSEEPRRVRERDLEGHLTHEEADPESEPAPDPEALDLQMARALEVLKSWTYFERLKDLRAAAGELPAVARP